MRLKKSFSESYTLNSFNKIGVDLNNTYIDIFDACRTRINFKYRQLTNIYMAHIRTYTRPYNSLCTVLELK